MKTLHFETIDSTNTYLKENYKDLENYFFVSASNQTKGRGRNNRVWNSDNNNLLFSLLVKDKELFPKYKSISIVTAYSIIEVLKEYGINNLSIKWPNDIYVKDKKLAGILLESISLNTMECLIIGVGLNVNQKEFVGDYLIEPSSLSIELNKEIDIDEIKDKIYKNLIKNLDILKNDDPFYLEIEELNYLKGKDVVANINDQKVNVKVLAINKDYSLRIEANHQITNIETGEISFHM